MSLARILSAIRAEALLVACGPLLGFIIGRVTSSVMRNPHRRPKVPWWAVLLLLPFVFRGKQAELGLVRAVNIQDGDVAITALSLVYEDVQQFPPSLVFAFGALEALDAPSDGIAIASASFLNPEAHRRYVESWRNGTLSFMAPLLDKFGLAGVMSVSQLFASTVQTSVAFSSPVAAADLGGLGALAKRVSGLLNSNTYASVAAMVTARVLMESAPQLVYQTSLIMAQKQSLLEQPAVAFSICLSFLSMCKKVIELIAALCTEMNQMKDRRGILLFGLRGAMSILPLLIFLLYMAVRVYKIDACPSHMWGISTGCVGLGQ